MHLSELFRSLDAPLVNIRWSWGAIRSSDGAVFLRVWQDQTKRLSGHLWVQVTDSETFEGEASAGHEERLQHIDRIRGGARSYMIMCSATELGVIPRCIAMFNHLEIFVGGELKIMNGEWWLEAVRRLPLAAVR